MIKICAADPACDLALVRLLFREYAQSIEVDLCFQNFEEELASLPGKYALPHGRLLLAFNVGQAIGCVALRPIDSDTCEMKRLYVQPQARGLQLGTGLVQRICKEARDAGYRRICLDTLPSMTSAIQLYKSMGFKAIGPYVFNPVQGALFLGMDL